MGRGTSSKMCSIGIRKARLLSCEKSRHQCAGAKLVCVGDPLKGRAEQVARELGIEKWSEDPYEVLEDIDIDAVIIVTPTSTHGDMIIKICRERQTDLC